MSGRARIGIDLGTTNTVVAKSGSALLVPSERSAILPSVVAHAPNGKTLVGSEARRRRAIDPVNTVYSSKRLIGRRWTATETTDFHARYPFDLIERNESPVFVTRAGRFAPEDIGATLVSHLFAEVAELDPIDADVVVAVPAAFGVAQRDATKQAALRAGAVHVELVDEPIATARAFTHAAPLSDGPVAVYDLGGGTFELAVVSGTEVIGTASDLYLGGDDIDRSVADLVADAILAAHRWDLRDDPLVYDRLVLAAEGAKVELSRSPFAEISLDVVDPALPGSPKPYRVSAEQLATIAAPIVRRTFVLCDEALANAGVTGKSLASVLLAGGSSQLPIVSDMVGQYFGVGLERVGNPMELVAIGASIA